MNTPCATRSPPARRPASARAADGATAGLGRRNWGTHLTSGKEASPVHRRRTAQPEDRPRQPGRDLPVPRQSHADQHERGELTGSVRRWMRVAGQHLAGQRVEPLRAVVDRRLASATTAAAAGDVSLLGGHAHARSASRCLLGGANCSVPTPGYPGVSGPLPTGILAHHRRIASPDGCPSPRGEISTDLSSACVERAILRRRSGRVGQLTPGMGRCSRRLRRARKRVGPGRRGRLQRRKAAQRCWPWRGRRPNIPRCCVSSAFPPPTEQTHLAPVGNSLT